MILSLTQFQRQVYNGHSGNFRCLQVYNGLNLREKSVTPSARRNIAATRASLVDKTGHGYDREPFPISSIARKKTLPKDIGYPPGAL
ncbi:hypothetical protein [Arachidicoccus rhizosphaerae]|uniref:hypothetical protein n=1 Tax=Arachidicoccus rhizosphaerae TaxID=551991 RepID=UPI0011146660|nr:hypothetical protein [Arachidicoccus rhizosphaerae]